MKLKRQNTVGSFCNVLAWVFCFAYLTVYLVEIVLFWIETESFFELGRLLPDVLLLVTIVTLFASKEDRVWAVPSSIFVTGWSCLLYACLKQKLGLVLLVGASFHWAIALIVYLLFRYAQRVVPNIDDGEVLETDEGRKIGV